jgi:Xaa-Pro aminopeptidase
MTRECIADVYNNRMSKLQRKMLEYELDYIFLPVSVNQYYITGINIKKTERLTAVFISREKEVIIICPAFELGRVKEQLKLNVSCILTWEEQEDPYKIIEKFLGNKAYKIGVEATTWFREYKKLAHYLPEATFVDVDEVIGSLRIKKTNWEKQNIINAINIIDEAREAMFARIQIGTTELEACEFLRYEAIIRGGKSPSLHGVHLGVNTSFAHGGNDNIAIEEGTAIFADAGVYCNGYRSDITRSTTFGSPPPGYTNIFKVVLKAQRAALSAIEPGIIAEDLDFIARQIIKKEGFGEYFMHRLGHGLGMEVHEPPWIGPGQTEALEPGMVFTVEPGIYIPGKFGIRIEENVIVTENGCEILSKPIEGYKAISAGE